jgi:hypothetical protein
VGKAYKRYLNTMGMVACWRWFRFEVIHKSSSRIFWMHMERSHGLGFVLELIKEPREVLCTGSIRIC